MAANGSATEMTEKVADASANNVESADAPSSQAVTVDSGPAGGAAVKVTPQDDPGSQTATSDDPKSLPRMLTRSMTESEFKADVESKFTTQVMSDMPRYKHTSCFCLKPENEFRKLMIKIAHAKWFDNFILFLILLNCAMMMMDHPLGGA